MGNELSLNDEAVVSDFHASADSVIEYGGKDSKGFGFRMSLQTLNIATPGIFEPPEVIEQIIEAYMSGNVESLSVAIGNLTKGKDYVLFLLINGSMMDSENEILAFALENGANASYIYDDPGQNPNGSAYHILSGKNNVEGLEILTDHYNSVCPEKLEEKMNITDPKGHTPLHAACQFGALEAVNYLLEYGTKLNFNIATTSVNEDGRTPLHFAALGNQQAVYDRLLELPPEESGVGMKDLSGHTAAYYLADAQINSN